MPEHASAAYSGRSSKAVNFSASALSGAVGDHLVDHGLVDKVQLEYARQKQAVSAKALWRIMIDEGLCSETVIATVLGKILDIDFISIDEIAYPNDEILKLFNKEQCVSANFLPIRREGQELVILLGDAIPSEVQQIVLRRLGSTCSFLIASFSSVTKFIRNSYYFAKNPLESLIEKELRQLTNDRDHVFSPESLLNHLLHFAVRERATDIHITSGATGLHILFRVDGVLQPIRAMASSMSRLLGFIKISAEMDISEQRRPQDGSFRVIVLDEPVTIRVSTIVTEHGERTVMRLLPEAHDIKDLGVLGFFANDIEVIARAMASPAGLILITGPTGSGKSSTLHAGLRMQHLVERNVLTVEDPLEYRVPLAGQTEVNRRAGYNFETALRHFLRHDPDVILVGEMRDAETARAALDASATGHLVLSTLHVTTVFGVVPRLTPFGLAPQIIAENLKLVINQRLVRRLCGRCAETRPFSELEKSWLGNLAVATGMHPMGCVHCRGTGFFGRLPLYEILAVDERMANAIADGASRKAIRMLAIEHGFTSAYAIAKKRVALGQTTIEEVRRVLGDEDTA